jgi:hypothetical protein
MAVSRPAPIAHHQKKTNTDASSKPSPSPTPKAPILAANGRRPSAASNRSRRCQSPPTRSASPPSSGTRATTSISANPCPGLIGTNTGPSSRAGTANSTKARTNRIAHPCSHLIGLPLPQRGRDDGGQAHSADLTGGGPYQPCRALLGGLANEASGHPGRASPSGRAGDHHRHAPSSVVLAGRAPEMLYASVNSDHPRTTTVPAHACRPVGPAPPGRAEGASQAHGRC